MVGSGATSASDPGSQRVQRKTVAAAAIADLRPGTLTAPVAAAAVASAGGAAAAPPAPARSTHASPVERDPSQRDGREDGRVRRRREPDRSMPRSPSSEPTISATAPHRHSTPSRSAMTPNQASASQNARPTQNPTRPKSPANGRSRPRASSSHAISAPFARTTGTVPASARRLDTSACHPWTARASRWRRREQEEADRVHAGGMSYHERGKQPEPANNADDTEQPAGVGATVGMSRDHARYSERLIVGVQVRRRAGQSRPAASPEASVSG